MGFRTQMQQAPFESAHMPTGEHLVGRPARNRGAGIIRRPDGVIVRRCSGCHKDLPRTKQFWSPSKHAFDGLAQGWCRRCITRRTKELTREARLQAVIHYSDGDPYCRCCGDNRFEFLCLDHINGGGNAHRLEMTGSKKGGGGFWRKLERLGYPAGFQVLCHNCNMAKHIYGTCPYATSHVWPNTTRKAS